MRNPLAKGAKPGPYHKDNPFNDTPPKTRRIFNPLARNEEVEIEEGMRLIATHTTGPHSAKVYKDTENDEHRVRFFKNGQHQKNGDYHTDDKEDANSTAKYQLKKWHSTNEEVDLDKKYDTPVKKKPVSMMTKDEKDKNDERRKAYKEYQKSLRKEDVEIDEAKGEDAYYARYGAGGKKKSPEEVASDKKAAAIKKDRESYSKMRKDMGMNDYATTKNIVGEKIDVYAAMKARYGKDFKKKSPEEVAADKEKEVKKKSEMSKELIATATAKKVAKSISEDIKNKIAVYRQDGSYIGLMNNFSDAEKRYPGHVYHSIQTKPIKESVVVKEDYDAEGEMAKTELRAIAHKALQLHSMMEDDDQLESWLQSKITKAKYMIDSVYDYIVYNMPDDEDDEPAEDYMSALPYPNRPVGGGMYSEETGYKYLMTYAKFGSNKERQLTKHIKHTHIMFPEKPTTPERVRYVVANSPEHKKLKVDGYRITHYGEHKKDVTHKNIHKNEPTYAG